MRAITKLFVAALLVSAVGSSMWRGPSRYALLSSALAQTSPCGPILIGAGTYTGRRIFPNVLAPYSALLYVPTRTRIEFSSGPR
jgi:hypothetical protein